MIRLTAFFFIFQVSTSFTQGLIYGGSGGWHVSNGGILTSNNSLNALHNNVCNILDLDGSWGLDIGLEQRFGLSELNTIGAAAMIKNKLNGLGISFIRYGYTDYSEQKIALSYARKMASIFNAGLTFALYTQRIIESDPASYFVFDLGFNAKITDNTTIAAFVGNPASVKFDTTTELPVRLAIGLTYEPGPKVVLRTEVEKIIDRQITLKGGISYSPAKPVQIHLGGDIARSNIGFGITYNLAGACITGAYGFNSILGPSPALSFQYLQ